MEDWSGSLVVCTFFVCLTVFMLADKVMDKQVEISRLRLAAAQYQQER